MDRWESIFNREHQVPAKAHVCKITSGPFKPDGLLSRKWRSVNHLSIAHKTLRIYNIIFGMKKGQTWVARHVENFPKSEGCNPLNPSPGYGFRPLCAKPGV